MTLLADTHNMYTMHLDVTHMTCTDYFSTLSNSLFYFIIKKLELNRFSLKIRLLKTDEGKPLF